MVESFKELKHIVQISAFGLSVFFNTLLIFLVCTRSPKKLGSYKYLMMYFSVFAIGFSAIDFLTKPYIHAYEGCYIVASETWNRTLSPEMVLFLICCLCGCYAVLISIIAIHFIFRFFALERLGRLSYFRGRKLLLWMLCPIFFGIFWGLLVYSFFAPTEENSAYFEKDFFETFNLKTSDITYISARYWINVDGTEQLNIQTVTGILILSVIMFGSQLIVAFFGIKSYCKIRQLVNSGVSRYTKKIQCQLYIALVVQTLIPLIMLYIPIACYMLLPVFKANLSDLSEYVTISYALYPVIDPFPAMFMIDAYRYAIFDFLNICNFKSNRIQSDDEEMNSVSRNESR